MTSILRHADWLAVLFLGALLLPLGGPLGRTEHLGTDFAWMAGGKGRGNAACCAVHDGVETTVALLGPHLTKLHNVANETRRGL